MRAAIFNPYLDTLGGGERYAMAVATTLVGHGYKVDLQAKDGSIKRKLEERFGIDLSEVGTVSDIKRGGHYDVCFWISDGSIPTLLSRNNILHFQFPFIGLKGKTLLNRMKLSRINSIVVNSKFTKKFTDKTFGVDSVVVYPPVDVESFKPKKKENSIIYVGRFSQLTQSKKQDVLVRAFKKLYDSGNRDWKLTLIGGIDVGVDRYVEKLRKSSRGYPIDILTGISFSELKDKVGRAKVYWSASGFGEDEEKNPIKVEHFGITVVEAMSAGCVPLVYSAGGHKEIIEKGAGFLWKDLKQLLAKTRKLIVTRGEIPKLSEAAVQSSKRFSYAKFSKEFSNLL